MKMDGSNVLGGAGFAYRYIISGPRFLARDSW